jgi:lactate dehydrogenase-like 2-hydroxyacid dehydrogenase
MKPNALLVNTARGPIINTEELLVLLESKEISINLAFDVYEEEPIPPEMLERFKQILAIQPDLRFTFIPHNASADADTRGQMAIMELEDLLAFATATSVEDLAPVRLIPPHRKRIEAGEVSSFRIQKWFGE